MSRGDLKAQTESEVMTTQYQALKRNITQKKY
jgi:hypothetical protein